MKLILSGGMESLKSSISFFDWRIASAIRVDLAGPPRNWTGLYHLDEVPRYEALKVHGDDQLHWREVSEHVVTTRGDKVLKLKEEAGYLAEGVCAEAYSGGGYSKRCGN